MAGGKGNIRAQSAVKDVLGVVADSNQYNAADARLAISILEQRTETAGGLGMQEHLPTALSQEKANPNPRNSRARRLTRISAGGIPVRTAGAANNGNALRPVMG